MKKVIITLLIVLTLLFSSFGCGGASVLVFNNNWNEGATANDIGDYERQIYKVEYAEKFTSGGYVFNKSQIFAQKGIDFTFTDGRYETSLEVIAQNVDFPNKTSDVIDSSDNLILKYTTEFSIKATYSCKDDVYNDYVKTVTYFSAHTAAFAPIYSQTENKSSMLVINGNTSDVIVRHTLTKTFYSKNKYVEQIINPENSQVDSEKTYNYSFKTAIDNTQLLFAIRNLELKENVSKSIPAISTTYGTPQSLLVTNYLSDVQNLVINENDVPGTATDYAVNCVTFKLSSAAQSCLGGANQNTGREQILFIQKGKGGLSANKSQIIKYVTPLTAYGSFNVMGSLVYTLTDVYNN